MQMNRTPAILIIVLLLASNMLAVPAGADDLFLSGVKNSTHDVTKSEYSLEQTAIKLDGFNESFLASLSGMAATLPYSNISILTDKGAYNPGEKVSIVIRSNNPVSSVSIIDPQGQAYDPGLMPAGNGFYFSMYSGESSIVLGTYAVSATAVSDSGEEIVGSKTFIISDMSLSMGSVTLSDDSCVINGSVHDMSGSAMPGYLLKIALDDRTYTGSFNDDGFSCEIEPVSNGTTILITAESLHGLKHTWSREVSVLDVRQNLSTSDTVNRDIDLPATNNTAAPDTIGPLRVETGNSTYYPGETVHIYVTGCPDPEILITDSYGNIYTPDILQAGDGSFDASYALEKGIIISNYSVIVKDVKTGNTYTGTFEVASRPVCPGPIEEITEPGINDDDTVYLGVNVSKGDFRPGECIYLTVTTNIGSPVIIIEPPAGNKFLVGTTICGPNTYQATCDIKESIILGTYNVTAVVNTNGSYQSACTSFNITFEHDKGKENDLDLKYAAYDPVQKAIVLRINAVPGILNGSKASVESLPAVKGMQVKGVKMLDDLGGKGTSANTPDDSGKLKKIDVTIPLSPGTSDGVLSRYGLDEDATRASIKKTIASDGKNIHLTLDDKVDGRWYRLSTEIPDGYRVLNITRSDGLPIENICEIDRNTGEVIRDETNWYIDNGTLYFYDDPVNGYDVSLEPPSANYSMSIEVIKGGQLSAIIYPFNQSDSSTVIQSHDHLGRTEDNNYGYNIDADAGTKTAVRMYRGNTERSNRRLTYGNYHANDQGEYQDIDKTIVGFNSVPDGAIESVIVSRYITPVDSDAPARVSVTQKTILRNNDLWFATVYYINNTHASTDLQGFRFYQGVDFNFNGQYTQDNCFYINDVIYGNRASSNPDNIQVGGFGSPLSSYQHDVDNYLTVWQHISEYNLGGDTSYYGDGGGAMAWTPPSRLLVHNRVWTVPVIWAVGRNQTEFMNHLNYALNNKVYDIGIKTISSPVNDTVLNPITNRYVSINVTSMDVGLTDVGLYDQNARVFLDIRYPNGTLYSRSYQNVAMSIPYNETALSTFTWDIGLMPPGTYNLTAYTRLNNSAGNYIDQNSSNDLKTIYVHIKNFQLYPDQSANVDFGDNVFYKLNLSNMGSARYFDLQLTQSREGWPSILFYGDYSRVMARDLDGDGIWEWVNSSYNSNSNGLPDMYVSSMGTGTIYLEKLVPVDAEPATTDVTVLSASVIGASDTASSATLRTYTPLPPLVNKTFYLHTLSLNTTPDTRATNYTSLRALYTFWSQKPDFASDFNVFDSINVSLWMRPTAANQVVTAHVFYTDGANTVLVGSKSVTLGTTSIAAYNFTITPQGHFTVPAGAHLVLKIDNPDTRIVDVYHDNTRRSYIRLNTATYVNVDSIKTYNGAGPATIFFEGDSMKVTANVTDPIGSYDISYATIKILAPNGTTLLSPTVMAINRTDTANPSLWRTYDYSSIVAAGLPAGSYNIIVTGYESNGVTHTRNVTVSLAKRDPAISMRYNGTKPAVPGSIVSFKHTVTNLNDQLGDVVDLNVQQTIGWNTRLYAADGLTLLTDTDGDGIIDTGNILPLVSKDIVVKTTVPSTAIEDTENLITITGSSSRNTSVTAAVTDRVFIIGSTSKLKTLYFHPSPSASPVLKTAKYTQAEATKTIATGSGSTWNQNLAYARDFYVLGDMEATLYLSQSQDYSRINVSVYSVNSTSQNLIGSAIYQMNDINTPQKVNFSIPINDENLTIPRGNWIRTNIVSLSGGSTINLYQSSARDSHIDMLTPSYINVDSVTLYDSGYSPVTSTTPPSTVNVIANVTDPFGAYDISDVKISLIYGNGTVIAGPTDMAVNMTDPGTLPSWRHYHAALTIPDTLDTGLYNILVTANETNSVKHSMSVPLSVRYPVEVSACKTLSDAGASGMLVSIALTNLGDHTCPGVYAYDFRPYGTTISDASHSAATIEVDWYTDGAVNIWGGPLGFTLGPNESIIISYTLDTGSSADMSAIYAVGVDPVV